MKNRFFLALAIMAAFCIPSHASDDPKTLAPNVYDQLKSGKKLDKVWISPDYVRSKGFKVEPNVDYKAENRSTQVMEMLPKALGSLARTDSQFTLKVAVVRVTTRTFTGFGYISGTLRVEGRIVDADGKVVAAFVTKESGSSGTLGNDTDNYMPACDKIASAIAKDLM